MSSHLIVDFPHNKTVRFEPTCEYILYGPYYKSDRSDLFYKSQDFRDMRIANRQAVMDVHKKVLPLLTSEPRPENNGVHFDPDEIFGNEKLLTPTLIKKAVVARKNCVSSVLLEQARQDELGEEDPDAIARASRQYSKAAMSQARIIGLLQTSKPGSSMSSPLVGVLQR